MSSELYVKMTDTEYEMFKQMKPLEKYMPEELASALLSAIRDNGGACDKQFNVVTNRPRTTAHIRRGNYDIVLSVDE